MTAVTQRVVQIAGLAVVQAACLFVPAGSLTWPAAWWYLGTLLALLVIGGSALVRNHPEVVAERSRGAAGGKAWDRWITTAMAVPSLGLLVVAGLDRRWGWTQQWPTWVSGAGVVLVAAGYGLLLWAMASNPFFAQVVRIQSERGHVAVSAGPYRFVRHPGYLGLGTSMLGATLLLGSAPGWACWLLYVVLVVVRTVLEDRTLQRELPGYPEYAATTRFRLVPGIW